MATKGKIEEILHPKTGEIVLRGEVMCAGYVGRFYMQPYQGESEQAPNYRLAMPKQKGMDEIYYCGSAWRTRSKAGKEFFTLSFEGEEVTSRLAAFPALNDPSRFDIVTQTRRKRVAEDQAASSSETLDDEIPH